MTGFEGKVAIVTGSGWKGGIGKCIASTLSEKGAYVVVNDIDEQASQETARILKERGGRAISIPADISQKKGAELVAQGALDEFGRIDILVNNAGVRTRKRIEELEEDELDYVLGTNLKAVFFCCKAVIPPMKKQRYGRIVIITSEAGSVASGFFSTSTSPYAASKAGAAGLMRSLAGEVGPFGITVNAVAPGLVDIGEKFRTAFPAEMLEKYFERVPLKKVGRPEDIAEAVLFLASDSASYITGVELDVNGGSFMR